MEKEITMKKLILLALIVIIMAGCIPTNPDGSLKLSERANGPRVVVIDSCEYICYGYGMAHKGNCKFCAERRRKEQEELIRLIKER